MFQTLSCLPYVFGSVLACASLLTCFSSSLTRFWWLCLSLSSLITLPQTVRHSMFHCILRLPNSSTLCFPLLTCWTSRKRQSQTSKLDGKTATACSKSLHHTLPLRTCCREVYGNMHVEKMADLVAAGKFITLLTFELSSFRENGFLVLLHFPRCSRWYLMLDA